MRKDLVLAKRILQPRERQLTRTSRRMQPAIVRIRRSARSSRNHDSLEAAGAEEAPGPGEAGVGFLELLEEFLVVEFDAAEMGFFLGRGCAAADGGEAVACWDGERGDAAAAVLFAGPDAQGEHAFDVRQGCVWVWSVFCDVAEIFPAEAIWVWCADHALWERTSGL